MKICITILEGRRPEKESFYIKNAIKVLAIMATKAIKIGLSLYLGSEAKNGNY